jgi:hypothetical protein
MKKKSALLAGLLALLSNSASACEINYVASNEVARLIEADGRHWKISDSACAIITKNKLSISILASNDVLSGASVAWAVVNIIQAKSRVISSASNRVTSVDTSNASTPRAQAMMLEVIEDAVNGFNIEKAVDGLSKFTKIVK